MKNVDETGEHLIACLEASEQARKRLEGELRRSEEYFRLLIENASDIVTVVNSDGIILYESPSVERVLGYKPEELIGKNAFEFYHPDDVPGVVRDFSTVAQNPGATRSLEVRFRHKNGSWRVFEAIGKNIVDDSGAASIVVNSRDITERKRLEEELQRSEEYFRLLIENASDIVTVLNSDGIILYESPSVERVLGYKPEELIDKNVLEFFHPDDVPGAISDFSTVVQNPGATRSLEFRFRHKDGLWRALEAICKNLVDDSGAARVVVNSRDITERKRGEEELEKRTHTLGERVKEVECLYGISDLATRQETALEEILQGALDLVPTALQYPEITCARLILDDIEFRTQDFRETIWKLAQDIILRDNRIGVLEVYYLEERPESDEGPRCC